MYLNSDIQHLYIVLEFIPDILIFRFVMRKIILIYLLLCLPFWSVSSKSLFIDETVKKLNKNSFIFGNENYTEWNKWSECSGDCRRFRERFCRDEFEKSDIKLSCPVKTIREIISCSNDPKCIKNENLVLSKNTLNILPKHCGLRPKPRKISHKIFGGHAAEEHSWPWNLAFGYQRLDGDFNLCSATLISPQLAITAAHCVYFHVTNGDILGKFAPFENHYAYVILDNYHQNRHDNNQQKVYLTHFIIHPYFRHSYSYTDYDIAILRLERPIKQGPTNGFACISNDKNFNLPVNFQCYSVGWGLQNHETDKLGPMYDDRLHEVKLSLLSYERCKAHYGTIYINYTIHTCAGGHKKDTCVGDSGGGLFCKHPNTKKWMLYGVVSFGSEAGCGESIGVYSKISGSFQWIDDTLKSLSFL